MIRSDEAEVYQIWNNWSACGVQRKKVFPSDEEDNIQIWYNQSARRFHSILKIRGEWSALMRNIVSKFGNTFRPNRYKYRRCSALMRKRLSKFSRSHQVARHIEGRHMYRRVARYLRCEGNDPLWWGRLNTNLGALAWSCHIKKIFLSNEEDLNQIWYSHLPTLVALPTHFKTIQFLHFLYGVRAPRNSGPLIMVLCYSFASECQVVLSFDSIQAHTMKENVACCRQLMSERLACMPHKTNTKKYKEKPKQIDQHNLFPVYSRKYGIKSLVFKIELLSYHFGGFFSIFKI